MEKVILDSTTEFRRGETIFVSTPSMAKFPFAINFFDEEAKMYVSPQIFEDIKDGKIVNLEFATVAFRSTSFTINQVIELLEKDVYANLAEKQSHLDTAPQID